MQKRPITETHLSHVVKLLVEYCNRILERADCLLRQLLRGARARRGQNMKETAREQRGREKGMSQHFLCVCGCICARARVHSLSYTETHIYEVPEDIQNTFYREHILPQT
jgi:hypothetical protein